MAVIQETRRAVCRPGVYDFGLVFKGAGFGQVKIMTVHASRIHVAGESTPLPVNIAAKRGGLYRSFFKRAIDVTLVVASLPFILPFLAIVGLMIFAKDGHSPIFKQERVGFDGKRFKIWKFRTMVPDAEAMLERFLETNDEARAEWEEKQKLNVDPRITSVGRTLRRSSIDELPQLWNVLRGDMSLVGPRPMMPSQQALYPGHGYYRLRPGLTGSWQVTARSESSFADRASFDDAYETDLSFAVDATIVAKTVGVVLRGTGV